MTSIDRFSPAQLLALAVCAVALSGCHRPVNPPPSNNQPVPVTTLVVDVRPVPVLLEAVGRTEGSKEVEIRARVSGIIQKQLYSEGNFVRRGSVLFQIERAPFEIALAQARASAEQAAAAHEQAQREERRISELIASGAVSRRQAEETSTALRSAAASLAAASAQVRQAELNLSYTTVMAPIDGVTGRALHSEGSLVTANTDCSLLTAVTQTDPLWVRFALSETEQELLRQSGNKRGELRLLLADGSEYENVGRVNFTGSTVDPRTGTVQLRAEFANSKLQILPGQFATVRLQAGVQPQIVVPQTSVMQGAQGRFVWVVDAESKAAQRSVQTGSWAGMDWIIRDGLRPGDTVIVDNLMKLKPGAVIAAQRPNEGAAPSAAALGR
jgi:membrane fusion protein (multidrug efflux system)